MTLVGNRKVVWEGWGESHSPLPIPINQAMELSGARARRLGCSGWLRSAEKEVMIVYNKVFARSSLPSR